MLGKGTNKKKLKPVLNMQVLEILSTASFLNRVLLINWFFLIPEN
jgi:hypothetical protein